MTASGCGSFVQGVRAPFPGRSRLPRKGGADFGPYEGSFRGRPGKGRAAHRQAPARRLPVAVLAAAWPAAARQGRGAAARGGLRADTGRRRPPVLRLGGHLLDPAAGAVRPAARAQARRARARGGPEAIATANIGCLAHLQGGTATPVRHWIELLDDGLGVEFPHGNRRPRGLPARLPRYLRDAGDGEGRRRGEGGRAIPRIRSPTARCAPRSATTPSAPMRPTACCIRSSAPGRRAAANSGASAGTKRWMRSPRA